MSCFKKTLLLPLVAGALLLKACTPLLNSFPEGVQEKLGQVYVENIPERSGQYLRLRLMKTLGTDQIQKPRYTLSTSLQKTTKGSGVALDGTVTRVRSTVTLSYTLQDKRTGKVLKKGTLKSHGGYNYAAAAFYANTVSEQADEEALLETLCSLLVLELARCLEKDEGRLAPLPRQSLDSPVPLRAS
jgi:LPS-assembly lipoprotein